MKILVACDGSKPALRALRYVIKLVRQLASESNRITLINVHDDGSLRHARFFVEPGVVDDYLRELGEKDLRPARKLLDAAGIRHDMVIRIGHVAEEILDCARSGRFDMIVLGAKGRSAIADLLIGSVAHRVLNTADAPVLLVR